MIKDYIRWRDGLTEADRLDRQIARILGHSVPPPAPPVNRADTLGNNTTNSPINIVASASAAHCSGNNNNNNKHKSSGHNNFNPSAIRPGKAQIPVEIGHFSETSSNTVILNDNSTVNVSAPVYITNSDEHTRLPLPPCDSSGHIFGQSRFLRANSPPTSRRASLLMLLSNAGAISHATSHPLASSPLFSSINTSSIPTTSLSLSTSSTTCSFSTAASASTFSAGGPRAPGAAVHRASLASAAVDQATRAAEASLAAALLARAKTPPRYASRTVINDTYMRRLLARENVEKYKRTANEIYRAQLAKIAAASRGDETLCSIQLHSEVQADSGRDQSLGHPPELLRDGCGHEIGKQDREQKYEERVVLCHDDTIRRQTESTDPPSTLPLSVLPSSPSSSTSASSSSASSDSSLQMVGIETPSTTSSMILGLDMPTGKLPKRQEIKAGCSRTLKTPSDPDQDLGERKSSQTICKDDQPPRDGSSSCLALRRTDLREKSNSMDTDTREQELSEKEKENEDVKKSISEQEDLARLGAIDLLTDDVLAASLIQATTRPSSTSHDMMLSKRLASSVSSERLSPDIIAAQATSASVPTMSLSEGTSANVISTIATLSTDAISDHSCPAPVPSTSLPLPASNSVVTVASSGSLIILSPAEKAQVDALRIASLVAASLVDEKLPSVEIVVGEGAEDGNVKAGQLYSLDDRLEMIELENGKGWIHRWKHVKPILRRRQSPGLKIASSPVEEGEKLAAGQNSTACISLADQTSRLSRLDFDINSGQRNNVRFHPLALLLDAALEGDLDLVRRAAAEVPDVSEPNDEGITALHNAVCAGRLEVADFLVRMAGADVNAGDTDGWTPLHCAASCANLPLARLLVEHGAALHARTLSDHETPLEKCDQTDEEADCEEYLFFQQERLGVAANGTVYALFPRGLAAAGPGSPDAQIEQDELPLTPNQKLIIIDRQPSGEPEWMLAETVESVDEGSSPVEYPVSLATDELTSNSCSELSSEAQPCLMRRRGLVPRAYISCYPLVRIPPASRPIPLLSVSTDSPSFPHLTRLSLTPAISAATVVSMPSFGLHSIDQSASAIGSIPLEPGDLQIQRQQQQFSQTLVPLDSASASPATFSIGLVCRAIDADDEEDAIADADDFHGANLATTASNKASEDIFSGRTSNNRCEDSKIENEPRVIFPSEANEKTSKTDLAARARQEEVSSSHGLHSYMGPEDNHKMSTTIPRPKLQVNRLLLSSNSLSRPTLAPVGDSTRSSLISPTESFASGVTVGPEASNIVVSPPYGLDKMPPSVLGTDYVSIDTPCSQSSSSTTVIASLNLVRIPGATGTTKLSPGQTSSTPTELAAGTAGNMTDTLDCTQPSEASAAALTLAFGSKMTGDANFHGHKTTVMHVVASPGAVVATPAQLNSITDELSSTQEIQTAM